MSSNTIQSLTNDYNELAAKLKNADVELQICQAKHLELTNTLAKDRAEFKKFKIKRDDELYEVTNKYRKAKARAAEYQEKIHKLHKEVELLTPNIVGLWNGTWLRTYTSPSNVRSTLLV